MPNNPRFYFALISTAAALGIGNIFLYPYFSSRITGLFFIPYLIALVIVGVPLLILEFSIGKYFNKNVVDLFAKVRKWFSGIGWLMVFNAFIVMSFYAVILSWHIIYLFVTFGLQWKSNANSYFFSNVLQVSNDAGNFAKFSLPVFIALIFAWIAVFFCIRKGFESLKRAFFVILPLFVALMLFFMFYSLSLDNAVNGIRYFLKPNFSALIHLNVWLNAFSLALLSLGLSFGMMVAFGRKNENGFIIGNSFAVVIFKVLAGIAAGFVIFGILGFLSAKESTGIQGLVSSQSTSSFTILSRALPFFYKPALLSFLFFIFLSIFYLLGTSALAYSISHVLVHKFKTRHINAAIIVAGLGFLFGLLFALKPGFYIMDIVSHFVAYNILIAILLELIAIGWFSNSEKIMNFINQNSMVKIGGVWRFMIRYIIPLIVLSVIFFKARLDLIKPYNNYPWWALLAFGVGTVAVPLVSAFLMPQKILDRR